MNLLNKKILVFIGIFLALVVFPIEKSFASTSSTIKVNGIEVNITRDLGTDDEIYTVSTSDSLDSFSLKFDDNNKITLGKTEEVASWNVALTYRTKLYNGNIDQNISLIEIEDEDVTITVQSLSAESVSFKINKDLSDRIFNKMLVNHDPFTLTANSTGGKNITVIREKFIEDGEDKDRYTFSSSNEALESVEVRDGTDNIIINYENGSYEVSGQYKGISKSTTIAIGDATVEAEIKYNDDIKVGVLIENGRKEITLGSDHETIEKVAQMILDDKRNITEKTILPGETYEIVSNSNLSNISASGDGGKVKFVVDSNISSINKEITVNYSGNKVVFPEGTKITGPIGWTGEMSLPKIENSPTIIPSVSGHNVNVLQTITIGDEGNFTFDKPVQLIFNGQAGRRVGFIKGDSFTEIKDCDDTKNIPSDKQDCKYDSVSGLIVLTKHFTEFVVFTATSISISSGGEGGSFTPPASANLTGLILSGNPTGYTFSGSTYSYTGLTVAKDVSSITITPIGAGTITVNGSVVASGVSSSPIALTAGVEKTITVVTTEAGKSPKTYTIKVTRQQDAETPTIPGLNLPHANPTTPAEIKANREVLLKYLVALILSLSSSSTPTTPTTPVVPSTPTTPTIPTTPSTIGPFNETLSFGMRNDEVRQLQEFLVSQGSDIYPEGLVTGYFGDMTLRAVGRFQIANGIVNSASDSGYGVVGPRTRAKINSILGY